MIEMSNRGISLPKQSVNEMENTNVKQQESQIAVNEVSKYLSQMVGNIPNIWLLIWSFAVAAIGIGCMILFSVFNETESSLRYYLVGYDDENESGLQTAQNAPVFIFGCIAVIWFVISWLIEIDHTKQENKQQQTKINLFDNDNHKAHNNVENGKLQWNKKSTLYIIQKSIEPIVTESYEVQCEQRGFKDVKSRKQFAFETAARHVKGSALGLDLISQCQLEILKGNYMQNQNEKMSYQMLPIMTHLFRIRNHWLWNIFIHIIVIAHVCLSFMESKTKRTDNTHNITVGDLVLQIGIELKFHEAIPEFCLLLIELFDVLTRIAWMNMCPQHILRPKSEKRYAYINLSLILYIFGDLIANLTINRSLEFIIPVRPLMIVLMNNVLRREVAALLQSMWNLVPILKLYALVVLFCGIFMLILMGDVQHWNDNYDSLSDNIDQDDQNLYWFSIRSIITMFVFISSAENYLNVVYPTIQSYNASALIFFVPCIFVGLFTLMAMITAIFEDTFVQREATNRRRQLWWKRTGMIAAFMLVDGCATCDKTSKDGVLEMEEFVSFLQYIRKDISKKKLQKLFKMLDYDNSGTIDIEEFVTGIEQLSINRLFNDLKIEKQKSKLKSKMENFLIGQFMQRLRYLVLIFNFWIFCWINMNSVISNDRIDCISFVFLGFHVIDVGAKVICMGLDRYWNFADYHDCHFVEQFGHKADAIITLLSFIGTVAGWIISMNIHFDRNHYFRLFPCLCLLRTFIVWPLALRFLFMIKAAFQSLLSLFCVMFCVFFVYGVIGVSIFKGKPVDADADPFYTSFETLGDAFITLTQGFVGEAFHELMNYTISLYNGNWLVSFYIVSYFLIMTLLFGNLFFGLLLSVFGSLYDLHKSGQKLTYYEIKKAQMLGADDDTDNEQSQNENNINIQNTFRVSDTEAGESMLLQHNVIENSSMLHRDTVISTTIPEDPIREEVENVELR